MRSTSQIHNMSQQIRLMELNEISYREFRMQLQDELAVNVEHRANHFWEEISRQEYYFERTEVMIDELHFTDMGNFLKFFEVRYNRSRKVDKI